MKGQYEELETYPVLASWTQSLKTKHPVLGLAGVRILRVRVGFALTGPRRQMRLIPIFGCTFVEVDKCVKPREALLDLTRQRMF